MTEAVTHNTLIRVGGVPFVVASLQSATISVIRAAQGHEAVSVRLSNAYCVALASRDNAYAELLTDDGLNYPDGAPVAWCMRRWASGGDERPSQIRGPSLFESVLADGVGSELRHFFLGAEPATITQLCRKVERKYPGIQIAGAFSPPFGPLNEEFYGECTGKILEAKPDLVWVALGTPKQDFAASELARRTSLTCVAVGAAFDFIAETTPQAPTWVQGSGFEWVFRLATEPRRLWRRYLIGNTLFIWAAIHDRFKHRSGATS